MISHSLRPLFFKDYFVKHKLDYLLSYSEYNFLPLVLQDFGIFTIRMQEKNLKYRQHFQGLKVRLTLSLCSGRLIRKTRIITLKKVDLLFFTHHTNLMDHHLTKIAKGLKGGLSLRNTP